MAGYRFWLQCSFSAVLALAIVQIGRAQVGFQPSPFSGPLSAQTSPVPLGKPAGATSPTCKIYSLADLGDDPKLCKWIADTIPEMVQPASWKQTDVKLSYFAPSKILVINQTPAVHAQVDEFLQSMRKSLSQVKAGKHDGAVVPAQFNVPDNRPVGQVPASQAYPVPYPPVTPKHLFHFIIRYEGEGVIDANVVKFAKALAQEKLGNNSGPYGSSVPTVAQSPPPIPAPPAPVYVVPATTPGTLPPTRNTQPMDPADAPAAQPPAALPPPLQPSSPSPLSSPPPFPRSPI